MNEQVSFTLRGRNPDVLTCIANLSNDEVFTPPELAGRMLDLLAEAWAADHGGANLWADKTVRFLDPFTQSGVFLREITSRLTWGLVQKMPDLQERVNHILQEQVSALASRNSPARWRGSRESAIRHMRFTAPLPHHAGGHLHSRQARRASRPGWPHCRRTRGAQRKKTR